MMNLSLFFYQIDTAVRFLNNPNVTERPFQQKQSFLKSKGLTDEEIRISCDRANVHTSAVPRQQVCKLTFQLLSS